MKRSEIYRRAAELVANSKNCEGCCDAIEYVDFHDSGSIATCPVCVARRTFTRLLKPDDAPSGSYWFGDLIEENRGPRILALCFMAAIAEDEE